jgi:hypothetical protein
MGAWGFGIRQDDLVLDVIAAFEDELKAGKGVEGATDAVTAKYAAEVADSDDEPLLWIALADVQWTYGALSPQVLSRVRADLDSGRSLRRWLEDPRGLARRRAELEKFLGKIATAKPTAKKRPKLVTRAPKFAAGDCLSIQTAGGRFAAALVLVADHSNPEYGKNLIGVLNYLSAEKPTLHIFRDRNWLIRSHHDWNNSMDVAWYMYVGFGQAKARLEIVGRVEILDSDPKDSNSYSGWAGLGEQVIYQHEWDALKR